ncbi:MAG: uroporphyrinogen-III synthase [Planctomycetota bacterium]
MTTRTIWFGRAADACSKWIAAAMESGWHAKCLPLLDLREVPLGDEDRATLLSLGSDDCLFLTSPAAISFLLHSFREVGQLPDCKYGVIGPGSARRLQRGTEDVPGREPDYVSSKRRGSSLASEFLSHPVNGRTVFYGAERPRPELRLGLEAAGRRLESIVAYRNHILDGPSPTPGQPILLFSPSGAESLALRVDRRDVHPVLAIGPTTELAANVLQFPVLGQLAQPTPTSLAEFLSHA